MRWNEPNLGPTDVKQPHYVPRFWLSFFGVDGQVRVTDVAENTSYSRSVKKAAVQRGLYDVQVDGDTLSPETWFTDLEGPASSLFRRLVDEPNLLLELSNEEEIALSRFLCSQFFRVPLRRDEDAARRESLVEWVRQMATGYIANELGGEAAQIVFDAWKDKPDEFFMSEPEPYQLSKTMAAMLGEVQGFGNLLRAMPWRFGRTEPGALFLSDNPISRYPLPTRKFHGFPDYVYYVPLSPNTLLRIGHGADASGRGSRTVANFSDWETSLARHVVRVEARRYLYGTAPIVSQSCAEDCLKRVLTAKGLDGYRLQGLDPRCP